MKLRFVKRGWRNTGPVMFGGPTQREPVLVLQQWWENSYPLGNEAYKGEWRDIEITEEE